MHGRVLRRRESCGGELRGFSVERKWHGKAWRFVLDLVFFLIMTLFSSKLSKANRSSIVHACF